MRKVSILIILFQVFVFTIQGQNVINLDDDHYKRLMEILKDYDSHSVYIDTSEYVVNVPHALDINIQYAASSGYCRQIEHLFTEGADINSINTDKATPLHYAVAAGEKDAAEVILLLGGNADAQDVLEKTPLMVAVEEDNLDIAEMLINYGANVSTGDFHGLTPLHFAIRNESFYMVDMLLYYKTDPDICDKKGNTPLMYAIWKKNAEIADLLIQSGANPNIADKNGFTPFMYAAQNGDTLMLKLLHNAGADIYAINSYGYDALTLALRFGQNDAVKFLKSIGNLWNERKPGKIDPNIIALEFGQKNDDYEVNNNAVPFFQKFYINRAALTAGGMMTYHLAMVTGEVSFRAPLLKSGIFAAYTFTPVNSRVLVKSSDMFYQYYVIARTIEGGIFHDWTIGKNVVSGNVKFYSSLSGAYKMYSKYSGTLKKSENQFCIIPSAGILYSIHNIGLGAELRYMKTPFYKVYPVWMSLKISVNFLTDHTAVPGKQINISSNE
jgi:ankyrin repeat protein